jgi:mRNA-degrading endonuclease RelE of RelBE toxin-antitoxin system
MRYDIVLTPEAVKDLKRLRAFDRSEVKDAMEQSLRFLPTRVSKSGIKRLRGLSKPQYRLRQGDFRVFYDVYQAEVVILAVLHKDDVEIWLNQFGVWEDETGSIV